MKPTKIKIFISAIPLIIIFIVHVIIIGSYIIYGAKSEVTPLSLFALRIFKNIPFISTIHSFVFLILNPHIENGRTPISVMIGIIDNCIIGLIYFIVIYCIYSIVQRVFIKN